LTDYLNRLDKIAADEDLGALKDVYDSGALTTMENRLADLMPLSLTCRR
jgi:hypothetical protein